MQRIEVNVMTGEQRIVDLTPQETEQALAQKAAWEASQPQPPVEGSPVDKLKAFLAANPDVAALM